MPSSLTDKLQHENASPWDLKNVDWQSVKEYWSKEELRLILDLHTLNHKIFQGSAVSLCNTHLSFMVHGIDDSPVDAVKGNILYISGVREEVL